MWNLDTQARLSAWFEFRQKISVLSIEEAVDMTNELWKTAPISNQCYAVDQPSEWPDPWQLVVDNIYDDIAKALGMLYTITLSHKEISGEIRCYRDRKLSHDFNLAWLEHGKYVLNYDLGVRVNTELEQINQASIITICTKEELFNESNSSNQKGRQ